MSKISTEERILFIREMIDTVELIIQRHKGMEAALEDFEGKPAIFMCLAQIGETLNKMDEDVLTKYDLHEERVGAYYTRNHIVHVYEGVDPYVIEDILLNHLPRLEKKLEKVVL